MRPAKQLLKRLVAYLPPGLQTWARKVARQRRDAEVASRKARTQVSADAILEKLSGFDLSGDVIVHGSISNIGKLDCRVPELVARWLATLDLTRQTIICPALPYNSTMAEYLNSTEQFDVNSSPNAMGAISNIVMGMEGAMRSAHPTQSCVAFGKDAKFYTTGHEADPTPFGKNSPFRKLTERRGKILMFGVGLNSVTNFHVYEDLLAETLPFEVYLPRIYEIPCVNSSGMQILVSTRCHDPRLSANRECERARPFLAKAGVIESQRIGEAELSVMDARAFVVVLLRMLIEGQSIYGRVSLSVQQRAAVESCLDSLR
jgi:aminoglycoside 3-N-acetyltransferase